MSELPSDCLQRAAQLGEACVLRGLRVAGAESCTGGLIAAILTSVSGASAWFERCFVTYSNDAKRELIGVAATTLQQFGAVSEQSVREMAAGALANSHATMAYAVTGVAGPTGGSPQKPVGTVCFGFADQQGIRSFTRHFDGDRSAVRAQALDTVLTELSRVAIGL